MKLILVDKNQELCQAWSAAFRPFPEVEIVHGSFESVPEYDCMVSPANSFGLMDGGIDAAIIKYFGPQLQMRVLDAVRQHWHGEQPVGTSMLVPTGHPRHPWLAHTPTMRVPEPIKSADVVYSAMRAMLIACIKECIGVVLCPGLGTLTGRVAPKPAAELMALAYDTINTPPPVFTDWSVAFSRRNAITRAAYEPQCLYETRQDLGGRWSGPTFRTWCRTHGYDCPNAHAGR